MLARVLSCAIVGLDGALIEVEVDIAPGLPAFTIVGLPDAAVQEAKDRVRAAYSQYGLPVSDEAHHGQPGTGGPEEGRSEL